MPMASLLVEVRERKVPTLNNNLKLDVNVYIILIHVFFKYTQIFSLWEKKDRISCFTSSKIQEKHV